MQKELDWSTSRRGSRAFGEKLSVTDPRAFVKSFTANEYDFYLKYRMLAPRGLFSLNQNPKVKPMKAQVSQAARFQTCLSRKVHQQMFLFTGYQVCLVSQVVRVSPIAVSETVGLAFPGSGDVNTHQEWHAVVLGLPLALDDSVGGFDVPGLPSGEPALVRCPVLQLGSSTCRACPNTGPRQERRHWTSWQQHAHRGGGDHFDLCPLRDKVG